MNVKYTTTNNLCLGCGLCEDICPTNSLTIGIYHGEYRPKINEDTCLGDKCSRCSKICPGLGVELKKYSQNIVDSSVTNDNKYIGRYVSLYTGHSTDGFIRYHSASGGLVTGLLIYLIEKRLIDGAVVTGFSSKDNITPEPFIARTKEELISARSSKYCPVSMQGIRQQIRESEGKYVIVGLTCHIHGFRKIENIDETFKQHVFAYWGLYCSSGRTFYETEYILKTIEVKKNKIKYFSYRDEGCLGSLVIKHQSQDNDDIQIYKEKYGSYNNHRSFFIPRRCHYCIDHSAELSDISFGDIHIKPYSDDTVGTNSVIVRTRQMNELLLQAVHDGVIVLDELQEETLVKSQKMARAKKEKYGSLVYWGKKLGMCVPQYDVHPHKKMGFIKSFIYMMNLNLQYAVGHHEVLWPIIKFTIRKK